MFGTRPRLLEDAASPNIYSLTTSGLACPRLDSLDSGDALNQQFARLKDWRRAVVVAASHASVSARVHKISTTQKI
jgi:hypothetical protein